VWQVEKERGIRRRKERGAMAADSSSSQWFPLCLCFFCRNSVVIITLRRAGVKVALWVAQGGVAVGGGLMGDGFAGSQRNRRLSDTKLSSPRPGSFVVVVIFRF